MMEMEVVQLMCCCYEINSQDLGKCFTSQFVYGLLQRSDKIAHSDDDRECLFLDWEYYNFGYLDHLYF